LRRTKISVVVKMVLEFEAPLGRRLEHLLANRLCLFRIQRQTFAHDYQHFAS
jgi:hypothetical protein